MKDPFKGDGGHLGVDTGVNLEGLGTRIYSSEFSKVRGPFPLVSGRRIVV